MGVSLEIVDSVGPVLKEPIDTPEKVAALGRFDPAQAAYLADTVRILRGRLAVPVIGFSGAPFTLASYLIEGRPSRTWEKTKRFMLEHPQSWQALMEALSESIVEYLSVQTGAGAQAVQLFDSWVGCLSPSQYRAQVLPHMRRMFAALGRTGVPRIHFGTNTAGLLKDFADVECEVVGVDWRVSLSEAKERVGPKAIQGNLDPAMLLAPQEAQHAEVDRMLSEIDPKQGYIFNLGHGMPPQASNDVVRALVEYVHGK
jgi:uroporphyrinogen decarboxylase